MGLQRAVGLAPAAARARPPRSSAHRSTRRHVVVGSGSADLWIRSDAADTDLEVTISEIRPDGQEMYVQSGWLRASHRALDEDAIDRAAAGAHPPRGRCRAARRRRVEPGARRAVPVRPRLPRRLAVCGSRWTRRAATAPSGSSRRSPPARPSRSPTTPTTRRASCCRSSTASTCPPTYPACTLPRPTVPPGALTVRASRAGGRHGGAGRRRDGRRRTAATAWAARTARSTAAEVAEVAAPATARQPPRHEAGGEGVAGADRVDDGHGLDGDHRRAGRRPDRRAPRPRRSRARPARRPPSSSAPVRRQPVEVLVARLDHVGARQHPARAGRRRPLGRRSPPAGS